MVAVIDAMRKQLIIDIQRQTSKPAEEVGRVVDELLIPEYKNRIGELNGIMADLYAVNYTVDELHRLTEFYRSPLGRRVVEQMPKISAQSVAVGQAWGVHVAQEAVKKNADELRRRGITL